MRVLVDTDILIDVALDRAPFAAAAAGLLDLLEQRPGTGFIAWHAISNFHYLVSPTRGKNSAREFLRDLTAFLEVAPATAKGLRYALQLPVPDFEDALQVAAADACGAKWIATRNRRDYRNSPIPALDPEAVRKRMSEGLRLQS